MSDMNQVIIVGRLTRDAEVKYTNSGLAVMSLSIANNVYRGKGKEDHCNFVDVKMFGERVEKIQGYLPKGKQVCVSGEINQNRWDDSEGKKHSKIEIIANNIQMFGSGETEANKASKKDDLDECPF